VFNNKQKLALWLGMAAAVALLLYPPWSVFYGNDVPPSPMGHASVMWPPEGTLLIAWPRLALELTAVLLVSVSAVLTLADDRRQGLQKPQKHGTGWWRQ
jgi:hypothetical protein